MQDVVASPTDAIFNLAGITGLPTIAPVLNEVLTLGAFTINSLYIAPLVADSMTVTFTPFSGSAHPFPLPCSSLLLPLLVGFVTCRYRP
jgi:hypothetical protein